MRTSLIVPPPWGRMSICGIRGMVRGAARAKRGAGPPPPRGAGPPGDRTSGGGVRVPEGGDDRQAEKEDAQRDHQEYATDVHAPSPPPAHHAGFVPPTGAVNSRRTAYASTHRAQAPSRLRHAGKSS